MLARVLYGASSRASRARDKRSVIAGTKAHVLIKYIRACMRMRPLLARIALVSKIYISIASLVSLCKKILDKDTAVLNQQNTSHEIPTLHNCSFILFFSNEFYFILFYLYNAVTALNENQVGL